MHFRDSKNPASPTLESFITKSMRTLADLTLAAKSTKTNLTPKRLLTASMASQFPSPDTYWYKQDLFAFSFDPNDSSRLRISCTQANCTWENTRKDLKVGDTGVLHRHYRTKHSGINTIDPARAANRPAAADPLDPVAAVEELEYFVKREHGLGPYGDDSTRLMTKKERELAAKKQYYPL